MSNLTSKEELYADGLEVLSRVWSLYRPDRKSVRMDDLWDALAGVPPDMPPKVACAKCGRPVFQPRPAPDGRPRVTEDFCAPCVITAGVAALEAERVALATGTAHLEAAR